MTERQPGRDERQIRENSPVNPDTAKRKPVPGRSSSAASGDTLFDTDSDRRLFGEGSYAEGGSNQEGNFKERERARQETDNPTGPDESIEDT